MAKAKTTLAQEMVRDADKNPRATSSWHECLRRKDPEAMAAIEEVVDMFLDGAFAGSSYDSINGLRDELLKRGAMADVKKTSFNTYVRQRRAKKEEKQSRQDAG